MLSPRSNFLATSEWWVGFQQVGNSCPASNGQELPSLIAPTHAPFLRLLLLRAVVLEIDRMASIAPLWQTLLPVATTLHAADSRKARRASADAPALGGIRLLEQMGRSLELVARLIAADEDPAGTPMVAISNRETAVEILRGILVDSRERGAYAGLVELHCKPARTALPLDNDTATHVLNQRWSQLSSVTFARLLLSPDTLDELSKKISDERPSPWESLLPPAKPRGKTAAAKSPSSRSRR